MEGETPLFPEASKAFTCNEYCPDAAEELFQVVASSISRDADLLNVGYHPTYGIPLLLQVDPSSTVADDYLIFQVLDFAPAAAP